jgi:hypothetical protein
MSAKGIVLLAGLVVCTGALAVDKALLETPLRDPWLPPHLRKAEPQPPARDVELKAQVERMLRASFDAADTEGRGSVTLEQARSAGLGIVANNFARIDAKGTGRVSFEEFKRYLRAQGADL